MIVEKNVTKVFTSEIAIKNPQYEQLLADVWVGIVLTLLLLSCVCCMCSCLLYHKFQQWKRSVLRSTLEPEINSPNAINFDCESLPSYTMASGLPTYEEALQQMDKNFEKGSYLPKEDSTYSIRLGSAQSSRKIPPSGYLNNFVREKT